MSNRLPYILSIGNFVVGIGAFVAIGLISPIATAYHVSPEEAGRVMTWYAIAYAVGAPLVTVLAGSIPRRIVLSGGLAIFALGAIASALAPTLDWLEVSRMVVAVGAGLFTPGAAAAAVATSTPERRASALSVVFAGLTMAQAFGVPIGAWAGYTFGFAVTFWAVAGLAVLAAILVYVETPAKLPFQPTSLAQLGETLTTARLILPILFTSTMIGAIYVVYTFLGPLIETRYGFGRDGVTLYFILFGAAAVFGNFIGGFSADRFGPSRTLLAIGLAQAVMLPIIAVAPLGAIAMGVAVTIWSLCGWSFMTPQQSRLVAIAPDRAPVMLSLNASAIYLGVALGSAVGSLALGAGGWALVAITGSVVALLAIGHLLGSDRLSSKASM